MAQILRWIIYIQKLQLLNSTVQIYLAIPDPDITTLPNRARSPEYLVQLSLGAFHLLWFALPADDIMMLMALLPQVSFRIYVRGSQPPPTTTSLSKIYSLQLSY